MSRILNTSIVFTIITFISKILGLVRDSLMAHAYGATYITDAYNIAITVPTFFYQVIGAALMTTFIPFFKEQIHKNNKAKGYEFANEILTIMTIIMGIMVLIIAINSELVVKIMAPNFDERTLILTSHLIRLTSINMFFMTFSSISSGIVQSFNYFFSTSLMGIMLNIPVILYLIFSKNYDIYSLTICTGIGFALQFLTNLPYLKKINFKFKLIIDFRDENLKKLSLTILPILLGTGVQQFSVIIDKIMGSSLSEGTITTLEFATKINGVVYSVFATAILTTFYPKLAQLVIESKERILVQELTYKLKLMLTILIPITSLIILFRQDVISVLFKSGKFDLEATISTSIILGWYVIAIPFTAIRDMCGNVFYSYKDTKTPAYNGIIAVGLNIVLNLILTPIIGVAGIAISTSVSIIVSCVILIYKLKNKLRTFNYISIIKETLKLIMAAIVMGIIVNNIASYFNNYNNKIILIGKDILIGSIGIVIFVLVGYLIRCTVIKEVINKFINRLRLAI